MNLLISTPHYSTLRALKEHIDANFTAVTVGWDAQHKEDGSHGDVTADSVVATGLVSGQIHAVTPHANASLPTRTWYLGSDASGAIILSSAQADITKPGTHASGKFSLRIHPDRFEVYSGSTLVVDITDAGDLEVFDDIVSLGGDFFGLSSAAGRFFERGRVTAMGEWLPVSHSAGNFTGNGSMTWTVASGDQVTFAYALVGMTLTVSWTLDQTSVGGTPSTVLQIAIPGGFTAARAMDTTHWYSDNGTIDVGLAQVLAGGQMIRVIKKDLSNWTASTNNTATHGQISFEVQ